jgi:cytochrome c biogenesis protein CcmG/thiol:disulfide interchange protein DsbE
MKKIFFRILPFLIFVSLSIFLWKGLNLNPREIPSAYIDKKIPKFSLPLLIKDQKGVFKDSIFFGEVSLLNVWASWCMACKDEQVFLLKLADSGIKIYGLNYKDDIEKALDWLKTWGNPYKSIGADSNGIVALNLGVYGTPETFIIDKNGVIRYRYAGILNEKIWQEKFLPVLSKVKKDV